MNLYVYYVSLLLGAVNIVVNLEESYLGLLLIVFFVVGYEWFGVILVICGVGYKGEGCGLGKI